MSPSLRIVVPSHDLLAGYVAALQCGWSPDTTRPQASAEELAKICGVIGLRWQPGTSELPPYVMGHIGYSVVPWKRRRGYATRALAQARREGLTYVTITTDPGNAPSQRVIEANGGGVPERFLKPAQYGGQPGLRYRVPTPAA